MPKVKHYTPAWLAEPNPGRSLFRSSDEDPKASAFPYASKKITEPGLRRTIARRGTEVFVANGRELRWGDLVYLKDAWESRQGRGDPITRIKREDPRGSLGSHDVDTNGASHRAGGYRAIKTPVADDIRQLIISPQADYMAIVTAHTVHVLLLPDSSHLTAEDTAPLKPRYFTLGPTTHVTSRSPIASAIWHPLGVNGSTLVTVTKDAVVRIWELSPTDRWSFDSPTLAIDLKRLADGKSLDEDFSATASTNKTFSPDTFDMEVAAACFGGRGSGGWSSMTLWIAMRGGDVYALCPLLPQRWAPPPTLIPSLSVSIVAKVAVLEDDPEVSSQARRLAQQQFDWMSDLDNQEPKIVEGSIGEPMAEIYNRPSHPGIVPQLQGPFELDLDLDSDLEEDYELCDIYTIGERADMKDLMNGEDVELEVDRMDQEGLSLSVICLLSTSGRLRICLDLDGVEAKWLPPPNRSKSSRSVPDIDPPSLLTFQTLDLLRQQERKTYGWPMLSPDVTSRYSFFLTHPFGITYISLSPWVFRLEQELQAESEANLDFRINMLVKGQSTTRERVYTHPQDGSLAACTAIRDPDLGYFLLSATHHEAIALVFDTSEQDFQTPFLAAQSRSHGGDEGEFKKLDDFVAERPSFQPPEDLNQQSDLERAKGMLFSSRHQFLKDQEVRLSPATLEIFTNAHRLVGAESARLNQAAAQLFTKLESLPAELHEQIIKANLVKERVDKITGEDVEQQQPISDNVRLIKRLADAQARQNDLTERMEKLKRRVNRATGRELSDKERLWMQEVRAMEASILGSETDNPVSSKLRQPWKRLEDVKALKNELQSQAEKLAKASGDSRENGREKEPPLSSSMPNLKIPAEIRKAKVGQIMGLLEREAALVDAVKNRLERLSLG